MRLRKNWLGFELKIDWRNWQFETINDSSSDHWPNFALLWFWFLKIFRQSTKIRANQSKTILREVRLVWHCCTSTVLLQVWRFSMYVTKGKNELLSRKRCLEHLLGLQDKHFLDKIPRIMESLWSVDPQIFKLTQPRKHFYDISNSSDFALFFT